MEHEVLQRALWALLEPELARIGYELIEIELAGGGSRSVLRVFIDKPGGITLDDCVAASRQAELALDASDLMTAAYTLEMSSPGADRPLRKPEHFERYTGRSVRIHTHAPVFGRQRFTGVLAGVDGEAGAAPTEVMFQLRCDAPGVELRTCPSFSAMEGTNTWALRCTDLFVPDADVIAHPAKPLIGRIRAGFILLQCGFGLGVTQGAIDAMWQVEPALGHVNCFLEDRPDGLQAELDALWARVETLAATPFDTSTDYFISVLDARAHASELALRAAQSSLLHAGARGYLLSSDVQRRVRESHFVAIVSPAIKHLRKEMARLSQPVLPA